MDQINIYKDHYMYNDVMYEVCGTKEFHFKLINDSNYAATYFNEVLKNEAVNDEKVYENVYDTVTEKSNIEEYLEFEDSEEMYDGEEIEEVIPEKDGDGEEDNEKAVEEDVVDEASWDDAAVKLLLHEYSIRKNKFRSPKIKKTTLWREICASFKHHKIHFCEKALSKKFGNIKTTYAKIKKNNSKKTTGAGRKPWPWLKAMDEIFHNDVSINFRHNTVTSMSADVNAEVLNLSKSAGSTKNGNDSSADGKPTASTSTPSDKAENDPENASPKFYKSARGKNAY